MAAVLPVLIQIVTRKMAAAADKWLGEFDNCEKNCREILENINKRDRLQRSGDGYAKLNVTVRQQLKLFTSDLVQLRQNLIRSAASSYITQRELERRQMMLDNLEKKQVPLQDAFNRRTTLPSSERSTLFGEGFSDDPVVGWNAIVEDTDETRSLSIDDIRTQQQLALDDQDQGLEALSKIVARQKQVAYAIGDEVDLQNELIDDITDHTDHTRDRLLRETKHVKIVDRKDRTCGLWIVIILLMIAIIVVIAVPF